MIQNNANEALIDLHLLLQIPSSHPCYADHFPGDPLVPGALLLKWVSEKIEENLGQQIFQYKQIKFLNPVRPSDLLTIFVSGARDSLQLSLNVKNQDAIAMKGQLSIAAPQEPNGALTSPIQKQGIAHD